MRCGRWRDGEGRDGGGRLVKKVKRFRGRDRISTEGRWKKCFERWQENKKLTRGISTALSTCRREKGRPREIEFGNRRINAIQFLLVCAPFVRDCDSLIKARPQTVNKRSIPSSRCLLDLFERETRDVTACAIRVTSRKRDGVASI